MRWLSKQDPERSAEPGDEPRDATPGDDVASAHATDRPVVPVDLGAVDPTELGRATRRAVARALAEDLGDRGDVTSLATVPPGRTGRGVIRARAAGVLFGVEALLHVFEQVDTRVEVQLHASDGDQVEPGQAVATATGPLRSILTGERVALNFLGHLSGIATQVRRFVDAAGPDVALRDTRKTTPGLRLLEKAAVKAGGAHNHRVGLHDALLVKDNHIVAAGSVTAAVEAAFARGDGRHVQVEVTTLGELDDAIRAGATDILLDNFTPDELRDAVAHARGKAALEASGSIDLDSVARYAATGVDRIAIGRLTHSAPWLDVALDLTATDPFRPRPPRPADAETDAGGPVPTRSDGSPSEDTSAPEADGTAATEQDRPLAEDGLFAWHQRGEDDADRDGEDS